MQIQKKSIAACWLIAISALLNQACNSQSTNPETQFSGSSKYTVGQLYSFTGNVIPEEDLKYYTHLPDGLFLHLKLKNAEKEERTLQTISCPISDDYASMFSNPNFGPDKIPLLITGKIAYNTPHGIVLEQNSCKISVSTEPQ